MTHLSLAAVSEDGKRLLLVSDDGAEFTVDADDKLRAALRGSDQATTRPGQLEIKMESVLRPRDIQARIRAGETPEAVAAAAQTAVEKIMPYAAPVLAEREHVAQRAQRASLRRPATPSGTSAATRTLGDAVAAHLRARNVDPDGVAWDAWRREDGRWTLTAKFAIDAQQGEGAFTFDAPGNYVSAEDDDARWLVGDGAPAAVAAARPDDDLASARRRRLSAVLPEDTPDELPLGDDAIDLVSERPDETSALGAEAPVEAYLDDPEPVTHTPEHETVDDEVADQRDDEPAGRPARRKGRASVPSWDEIMFGGGKHD